MNANSRNPVLGFLITFLPGIPRLLTRNLRPSSFCRTARREFERGNPSAPIKRSASLQILIRKPERAVVNGVNAQTGVISPAAQVSSLRATTDYDVLLRFHCS